MDEWQDKKLVLSPYDETNHLIHYKTYEEAIEAWERRKQRISFENIVVVANTWDLNEDRDLVNRLLCTKYKTFILTTNK